MLNQILAKPLHILIPNNNPIHTITCSNTHKIRFIPLRLVHHVLDRLQSVGTEEHVIFREEVEVGEAGGVGEDGGDVAGLFADAGTGVVGVAVVLPAVGWVF